LKNKTVDEMDYIHMTFKTQIRRRFWRTLLRIINSYFFDSNNNVTHIIQLVDDVLEIRADFKQY
jgi:hypothetical protein